MKTTLPFLAAAALLLAAAPARAALVIPGADGSDGALHITNHTVIDLSQAITGAWDTNNAANAGRGVYDPEKWAVVFKYTDVNIAAGTTVTFTNHPTRAPVVWLVNGNVTISGALDLNGKNSVSFPGLAEPGPGGFRGGSGYYSTGASDASGFGPGAGLIGNSGSYGSSAAGMRTYRNPSLLPLVGGSGGSGMGIAQNGSRFAASGGGGGGAILIACQNVLQIDGRIRARGGLAGFADNPQRGSGNGSGGGVRMVCAELDGTGMIDAIGGNQGNWGRGDGGLGRIRVERSVNRGNVGSVPDPSVIDLPDGATALLWPPAGAPEVRILSIGDVAVPDDPLAAFGTYGADVALPATDAVQIVVETAHVEEASEVKIRVTPRSSGNYAEARAIVDTIVSADPLVIRWKAGLPAGIGYSAVQVHVIRP